VSFCLAILAISSPLLLSLEVEENLTNFGYNHTTLPTYIFARQLAFQRLVSALPCPATIINYRQTLSTIMLLVFLTQ